MFSIAKANAPYTWTVNIHIPVSGGKVEKHSFVATFKPLTASRWAEILEEISRGAVTDLQLATEVIVGWSEILDGENVVEYSEAAKARLLEAPGVATAVARAYIDSRKEAATKN